MTRQLVLLGVGLAHLNLLKHLTQHPVQGVQVTLVSARTRLIHAPMVAGWIMGRHGLEDCTLELEALVQHSGVRWLKQTPQSLDPQTRVVLLDDGSELPFDVLSINGQLAQSRDAVEAAMPGARQNALLTWPLETFCTLWPRVTELADAKAQRIAVIGNGMDTAGPGLGLGTGIELAFAIRQRLPGSAVTLLTGGGRVAEAAPEGVQTRIAHAMRQHNITVLADAAVSIAPGEVTLRSGTRLACDVPLVTNTAAAPVWAAQSGLALDEDGVIAVDASFRAIHHPHVFAPPREGFLTLVNQVMSQRLTRNLLATLAGQPVVPPAPDRNALQLMTCGAGRAIAQWGKHSAQGRWAGWLKHQLDSRLMAKYQPGRGHKYAAIGSVLGLLVLGGCSVAPPQVQAPEPKLVKVAPGRLSAEQANDVTLAAIGLVGTPYRYGGNTPAGGFDCSGLIGYVYKTRANVPPPRSVAELVNWGQPVPADAVRTGDLAVFIQRGTATHAGIYVGEGRFVHAPSTGGEVRLDNLKSRYWSTQQVTFRRP